MTKQEKQLLIKVLCELLPYRVKVEIHGYYIHVLTGIDGDTISTDRGINYPLRLVKPYLRPMSSMTDEEIEEYIRLRHKDCIDVEGPAHYCKNSITAVVVTLTSRASVRYWYNDMVSADTIDFLNAHYLDWRGLLPMEIALDAKDEMYK